MYAENTYLLSLSVVVNHCTHSVWDRLPDFTLYSSTQEKVRNQEHGLTVIWWAQSFP